MKLLLSIKVITEYSLWLVLLCIALGAVYAFVLYYKDSKLSETKPWLLRTMAAFRFLLISILAFFLLSPFVKTLFNKVEKPVIIIAHDNSESIVLNKDSAFYKGEYLKNLNNLVEKLSQNYEVKSFTFSDDLNEGMDLDFEGKVTDFSHVFEELAHKFYNKNVGAVLLASDGVFNQGSNPVYNTNIEFPVYTIALGDTSAQKDIILKEVVHNKITFLGNQFPIEIEALAQQCIGETSRLMVTHNGKTLDESSYTITENEFKIDKKLLIDAKEIGVQHYRVSLSIIENEISVVNNVKDIYVDVLDGRQNILILASAPHPDLKALKLSIENNENYKVTTKFSADFDGNVQPFSLVIAHQVNLNNTAVKKSLNSNVSVLHVLGSQTNFKQFNALNVGLEVLNSRNRVDEVLPSVTEGFPLFTLSDNVLKWIKGMPPLASPFGNYQNKEESHVLLHQKLGSVVTQKPLLAFYASNGKKKGVFAGEGIWRWRMQDYLKNGTHDNFNELINKVIQFLSIKEDKSKFKILSKSNYFENEEILLYGELYNESYELINEPEIKLELVEEEGNKYSFDFNRTATSYFLNAGILPPGFYGYKATVNVGNKEYTENGKFQIKQLLLEANNTVANHQLLQNVSNKFGGEMIGPKELDKVLKSIEESNNITSIIYEEDDLKELISLKWIFFILLCLLSLEWFLRKRNGAY